MCVNVSVKDLVWLHDGDLFPVDVAEQHGLCSYDDSNRVRRPQGT